MQLQVGDTVQFTATLLLGLGRECRDVLDRMVARQCGGGRVVSVTETTLLIDTGDASPILINSAAADRHLAVRVVARAADSAAVDTDDDDDDDADMPDVDSGAAASVMVSASMSPFLHPLASSGMSPALSAETPPQQVRLSQWVISQFLSLKQYGIAQDLNRNDDGQAGVTDPTGENWKKAAYRPVVVELSSAEESCYHAALARIQRWILADHG